MKPHGRHQHNRLTAIKVNSLKKPGRYGDGNGLYLVVDPSGAKRWILRTRVRGKRSDIGLGGLKLVPLGEARKKATKYRAIARDGGDPIVERKKQKVLCWKSKRMEMY